MTRRRGVIFLEFVNLYDHFEMYQNYKTTVVGHGGCRLTAVAYSG
jgi:hypothetical protein